MIKISRIFALSAISTVTVGSAAVPALCLNNKVEEEDIIMPKELLKIEDDGSGNVILKGLDPEKATPSEMFYWGYNKIVIPEEVTEIAPFAFAYHFDLSLNFITRIDFSKATNLKKIGDNAFNFCHKLDCDIDLSNCDQLTYIGTNAFFYCLDIRSFTFSNNVKNLVIGDHAFSQCESITQITIPAGVSEIKNNAFYSCVKLNKIDMSAYDSMPSWMLTSTWLFESAGSTTTQEHNTFIVNLINTPLETWDNILRKNQELGEKWKITSPHATTEDDFEYDANNFILKLKDDVTNIDALIIPDKASGIAAGAFKDKFTSGHIPLVMSNEITEIGDEAFYNCSGLYGNLLLPPNLAALGNSAFELCTNLRGIVNLPQKITALEDNVFRDSGIEGIVFTNKLKTLGKNVFTDCHNLALIDVSCYQLGDSPTTTTDKNEEKPLYGLNANGYMYLYNVADSQLIKEQWHTNFQNLGMSASQLTKTGTDLNCWTFYLKDETVPKTIPNDAYNSINNEKTDIRGFKKDYSDVKKIGQYGQIQIPYTAKTIGENAFYEKLKDSNYKWHLTLNNGLQTIQKFAFQNDTSLYGDLIIPNSVTSISQAAFYGCSGLQGTLLLPQSINFLGEHAFEGTNFARIILPSSLSGSENIGNHCFVIKPSTTVLDFSLLTKVPSVGTGSWIFFEEGSKGTIYVKEQAQVIVWTLYLMTLTGSYWDANNWPIKAKG